MHQWLIAQLCKSVRQELLSKTLEIAFLIDTENGSLELLPIYGKLDEPLIQIAAGTWTNVDSDQQFPASQELP